MVVPHEAAWQSTQKALDNLPHLTMDVLVATDSLEQKLRSHSHTRKCEALDDLEHLSKKFEICTKALSTFTLLTDENLGDRALAILVDRDGDEISFRYQWLVDGEEQSTQEEQLLSPFLVSLRRFPWQLRRAFQMPRIV